MCVQPIALKLPPPPSDCVRANLFRNRPQFMSPKWLFPGHEYRRLVVFQKKVLRSRKITTQKPSPWGFTMLNRTQYMKMKGKGVLVGTSIQALIKESTAHPRQGAFFHAEILIHVPDSCSCFIPFSSVWGSRESRIAKCPYAMVEHSFLIWQKGRIARWVIILTVLQKTLKRPAALPYHLDCFEWKGGGC